MATMSGLKSLAPMAWCRSNRKPTREVSFYKGTKVIADGLHPGWFERLQPSFGLALDAFISSLEGSATTYPTLMDGLRAQIIAEAAMESLQKNSAGEDYVLAA